MSILSTLIKLISMIQRGILLIVFCFCFLGLYGQCTRTDTVAIADLDTTYYELEIESIQNDDLSSGLQGVKSVHIDFKHAKIADLKVNLVSPSGQRVGLIGPILNTNTFTQDINWSVNFVACGSATVMPDLIFPNKWQNSNDWSNLNNYTGSYYPAVGCLQEFNTGTISGTWRLEVVDALAFGNGMDPVTFVPYSYVHGFSINFIDETGLNCFSCSPISSSITSTAIEGCQESSGLAYDVSYTVESASENYLFRSVLFDDSDNVVSIFDTPSVDLTGTPSGKYELCVLHVYKNNVNNLSGLTTKAQILKAIQDNQLCAKFSENCQQITITPKNYIDQVDGVICGTTPFEYDGKVYNVAGTYDVKKGGTSLCEEYVKVVVSKVELNVIISQSSAEFGCNQESITLTPQIKDGYSYTWSTDANGSISEVSPSSVATVTRPGVYNLAIAKDGCQYLESLEIKAGPDYLDVELSGQDILCASTQIDTDITGSFSKIEWFRNGIPMPLFENFTSLTPVTLPGSYMVKVVGDNCETTSSIEIKDLSPDIAINTTGIVTLTCENKVGTSTVTGVELSNYTIEWYKDNVLVDSGNLSYELSEAGSYEVRVKGNQNPCEEVIMFTVVSEIDSFASVIVNSTPITCDSLDGTARFVSLPLAYSSFSWMKDGELVSEDLEFRTRIAGDYTLEIVTLKGCKETYDFKINENLSPPQVTLPDTVLMDCTNRTELLSSAVFSDLTWYWFYPDGQESNAIPTKEIVGNYYYEATSTITGCKQTGNVTVALDTQKMKIVRFSKDTITCSNPAVTIIPSPANSFNFSWTKPGASVPFSADASPIVTEGGRYKVKVTEPSDPSCFVEYAVLIIEDKVDTLENIKVDDITCMVDSVQISVESPYTLEGVSWGPALGLSSTIVKEPFVSRPDTYYINYTFAENGCVGRDSVIVNRDASVPSAAFVRSFRDTIQCEDSILIEITTGLQPEFLTDIFWNKGNTQLDSSKDALYVKESGYYTIIVEGSGQCFDTLSFKIFADTLSPRFNLVSSNDIFCDKLSSTLSFTESNRVDSIGWYDMEGRLLAVSETYMVSDTSMYRAIGIDKRNKCSTEKTISVTDKRIYPAIEISADTIITCDKQKVMPSVVSSTAIRYEWYGATGELLGDATELSIDTTGRYVVKVFNDQSCESLDTFTVGIDTIRPLLKFSNVELITCNRPEVDVSLEDAESAWTYDWNNGQSTEPTIRVDRPGTIGLNVQGANGCIRSDSIRVQIDTATIDVDSVYHDKLVCNGPQAKIHVETKDTIVKYTWDGVVASQKNAASPIIVRGGKYVGYLEGMNGCIDTVRINIDDGRKFPFIQAMDVYTRCDGKETPFVIDSVSGVDDVRWIGVGNNYFHSGVDGASKVPGTYEVLGINAEGCKVRDTFNLIDEVVMPVFELRADEFDCEGSTLYAIDVEDDEAFYWEGPNSFSSQESKIEVDSFGQYHLIVSSVYGCLDTMSITPEDIRIDPVIQVVQLDPFQCNTETVRLVSNTPLVTSSRALYQWKTTEGKIDSDPAQDTIYVSKLGTYTVDVYDTHTKCSSQTVFDVEKEEQSFKSFKAVTTPPDCEGYGNGMITIGDIIGEFPPYSVLINGVERGKSEVVENLQPGQYVVTLVDSILCMVTDTVTVQEPVNPIIQLPKDTLVPYGTKLILNTLPDYEVGDFETITWSSNAPCPDCLILEMTAVEEDLFTLYVKSKEGCEDSAEMKLRILNRNHVFPNAITPNGDGVNDVFYIPENRGFEKVDKLSVFSNWGDLIYDSDSITMGDKTSGWDGRLDGAHVEPGVYVVYVYVTLVTGEKKRYADTITVLR